LKVTQITVFLFLLLAISSLLSARSVFADVHNKPKAAKHTLTYIPARPAIAGLHIAMSMDSAELVMKKIAVRRVSLKMDSLMLIESDSVRIFGEAAYLQIQILHNKIRTIVVNFHPLFGDHYINTRNMLNTYMEHFFGRGVITQDESVIYRRWENEDGTMEVSYTDKYTRVFVRLGKR
jgi:hypothetical protein